MNKDVCSACDSLKATSSNFIQKGVTDTICANLKVNQGFENKGHNNCTDMHDMNDVYPYCRVVNSQTRKPIICLHQDLSSIYQTLPMPLEQTLNN